MSIQDFEKLQAEIPTSELIEKARYWIRCMDESPNIGDDVVRLFGELCRRLEATQDAIKEMERMLPVIEELECNEPKFMAWRGADASAYKAALAKAKGAQPDFDAELSAFTRETFAEAAAKMYLELKQNAPGQTFVQPGDAERGYPTFSVQPLAQTAPIT